MHRPGLRCGQPPLARSCATALTRSAATDNWAAVRVWWNGRHSWFRSNRRKAWGFESLHPHHSMTNSSLCRESLLNIAQPAEADSAWVHERRNNRRVNSPDRWCPPNDAICPSEAASPHAPVPGATLWGTRWQSDLAVSTHAPVPGATHPLPGNLQHDPVSTHAPVPGATPS